MAEKTNISWCDMTWNPWVGCTKVSEACTGCYAEHLMDHRFHRVTWGQPGERGTRVRTSPSNWRQPLTWDRKAKASGSRPFVFCASLADVFDNQVDPVWRRDLFALIRETPNLTWLLLTKRPQMAEHLYEETLGETPPYCLPWPANAALGCTVVTQDEARRDIPTLLLAKRDLKPAFVFVSMEPLLEPVDLTHLSTYKFRGSEVLNGLTGELFGILGEPTGYLPGIDWVITGGETTQGDHKARATDPEWFRSLRDQCAVTGTPFHHKQMTEAGPIPPDLQVRMRPGEIWVDRTPT